MANPTARENEDDKPLDPAAERVRRKLVRFMAINLSILFAAVMAVVIAIVYRSTATEPREAAMTPPSAEAFSGEILLPADARIVSHAVTGGRLSLHVRNADGSEAILLYDMAEGREVGRIGIGRPAP